MKKIALAALGGTLAGTILTTQIAGPLIAQEAEKTVSVYEQLDLFGDIFERIRAQYVEEVDTEQLVEAAINGMLTSLDPHSSYLSAKDFDEMQEQTRGEFGGLGIEVTQEDGFVKVVAPMDGTPADKAGIKAGDFITHVNSESVLGLTLDDAVDKMRAWWATLWCCGFPPSTTRPLSALKRASRRWPKRPAVWTRSTALSSTCATTPADF